MNPFQFKGLKRDNTVKRVSAVYGRAWSFNQLDFIQGAEFPVGDIRG